MSHLLKTAAVAALFMIPAAAASAQGWGAPQPGQQRVVPRGSYAQSCSEAYVNQGRLYAECRTLDGQMRGSSIELARCSSSDIGNDDGLLVCQDVRGRWENNNSRRGGGGRGNAGDNGGGRWGDNSRGAITVYRDSDYRGASTTLRGEENNLSNIGLNDTISSMRFNGAWEACTDAHFRGQCQVFTDDVRNLDRWGMNDRVSSLRPARRSW